MSIKAIIVEDEKLAQERLSGLLEPYKEKIKVIDYADNGQEAIEKINKLRPELIFLDIQMPGKDGFDVLKEIDQSINPVIIFTTAYDQYALEAFESNTIDYLLKPISSKRLIKAINKIDNFLSYRKDYNEHLQKLVHYLDKKGSPDIMTKIKVHRNDEIMFLNLSDILFIKASGKYTMAYDQNREYLLNDPISFMESHLPDNFIRVHRSYIINTNYLVKMKKWFTGKYKAVIGDTRKFEIPVSRSYKNKLLNI